nr:coiled-coil domain-containing protein 127-like [Camelus dromedarius]
MPWPSRPRTLKENKREGLVTEKPSSRRGRRMVEAKKLLEQERARVLQEKTYPLKSRPDKEEDGQRRARLLLRKVGDSIAERQSLSRSLRSRAAGVCRCRRAGWSSTQVPGPPRT